MKAKPRTPQPPPWADRLLEWLAAPHLLEEVQGDLHELFHKRLQQYGPGKARLFYWWDLLRLVHPRLWRKKPSHFPPFNPILMWRHNLLLTYRTFKRFKSSFFINLVGLSTGLACTLLIYLWVKDELSVDQFYENDSQLYQVMQNLKDVGGVQTGEGTAGILAQALAEEVPEIEYAVSVVPATWFSEPGILSLNNARINASGQYVGKDYFKVFSCPFITGNKKAALADKYSLVLSDELALKFFHTTDNLIGKTVEWNQGSSVNRYHITGVFKKPPAHATAQFDLLLNYDVFLDTHPWLKEWDSSDPSTFVTVRKGTDIDQLNSKIKGFIQSEYKQYKESEKTLLLQRYSERYLHGHYENGRPAGGRIEYVRLFSTIALFILIIACINFMNLSTAKASRRLKEVGIKKALGASRKALVLQYFEESMLMTFLSLLVAVLLVVLLLPRFNEITGKALTLSFNADLIASVLALTCGTGLIAGSYPALYLSGFRPAVVLKGKLESSVGELLARKGLVIFQFAVSIVLIVSVVVVYQQIDYVQSKNLGYNRDNILHFELEIKKGNEENFFEPGGRFEKDVETFLNEVKNIPGVVQAASFEHDLTGRHGGTGGVDWEEGNQDDAMSFSNLQVGYDFIETLGIDMAAGRNFSREFSDERNKIIFNEAAIERMGLKDPVGKRIRVWGQEKQIIGVAKNFHYESLYEEVKPCLFQLEPRGNRIMVKLKRGAERETVARLGKLYGQYTPGLPFDYQFIDEDYQALYASEKRVSILSKYFAGMAILISCLGLFGLAAFTAERRRKEIGIRKALGSGEWRIVYLLSGEFTKLVFIAIVIALPVSYLLTKHWLDSFAYRIPLQAWYFVGAGLLALLIAWLTVGMQAVRAARINPIHALKEE